MRPYYPVPRESSRQHDMALHAGWLCSWFQHVESGRGPIWHVGLLHSWTWPVGLLHSWTWPMGLLHGWISSVDQLGATHPAPGAGRLSSTGLALCLSQLEALGWSCPRLPHMKTWLVLQIVFHLPGFEQPREGPFCPVARLQRAGLLWPRLSFQHLTSQLLSPLNA